MIVALVALGCAAAPSPAEAYARALDPSTPSDAALRACADAGSSAEECVAAVVRARTDVDLSKACAPLTDARWRGECFFAVAERRAAREDRAGALVACGRAGPYYDECLYHAWTLELQAIAARPPAREAAARLVDAQDAIDFWSGIETIGPEARAQIEDDWWFFAHARNRPARMGACADLEPGERARACERGTRTYVRRSVVEALRREDDRACRGGPEAAHAVIGALYVQPDAELDGVFEAAVAEACTSAEPAAPPQPGAADGAPAARARPWNPSFRPRARPMPPEPPLAEDAP